jgi:hypothetical protein
MDNSLMPGDYENDYSPVMMYLVEMQFVALLLYACIIATDAPANTK